MIAGIASAYFRGWIEVVIQRGFEIIVNMLKDTRGSKAMAAERLGISPRTLRYKVARMRESGLDVDAALLQD